MKSNIEMKMELMERRQAVHANKIQALMLMVTVMQIPEKEKNRKILKAVRVSTAVLWLLTCIKDVVLMIRKNYNWLAEKYSWYMIVIKILDEKDWERKWIKKIGIVTGWVCLKMAWHWRKTMISCLEQYQKVKRIICSAYSGSRNTFYFGQGKWRSWIYINYVGGAMILMSLSFAVLLYEVEYKKLESKFNKNQFCGIINSSFYTKKKGNIWE